MINRGLNCMSSFILHFKAVLTHYSKVFLPGKHKCDHICHLLNFILKIYNVWCDSVAHKKRPAAETIAAQREPSGTNTGGNLCVCVCVEYLNCVITCCCYFSLLTYLCFVVHHSESISRNPQHGLHCLFPALQTWRNNNSCDISAVSAPLPSS